MRRLIVWACFACVTATAGETGVRTEPVENAPLRTREVAAPWRTLARGTFYRFQGDGRAEDLELRAPADDPWRCRYLRLTIHNRDDAPLRVQGAAAGRLVFRVVFPAEGAGPYALVCGRPEGRQPSYDLVHFVDRLRPEGVTEARLEDLVPNPAHTTPAAMPPWSERHKWLLWVVLVGVLAVLGWLVWRQTKAVGRP